MTCGNCRYEFCWLCEQPYNTAPFDANGHRIHGHDPKKCKKDHERLIEEQDKYETKKLDDAEIRNLEKLDTRVNY